ncbi:ribonuclease HII [Paraliobacillus quinghaiensis]|uniref:Ribonuclease HII n=1 Tax=Paraliobacillus quinghaiensis TaxID=470815 RepID=A0A917TG99_9BACI|nr:ribonuclease HII [Paraliobacillus quinghaiensis]GGM21288.1 ribonuclease HII [Paraliobacillus quinghaiensis]
MGNKQSVAEIKAMLAEGAASAEQIDTLKKDDRKGVQNAIEQYFRNIAKQEELIKQFDQMMVFERTNYQKGKKRIAGVDEVGRGPLAGPVVAAAVILPEDIYLPGINDSKKMSKSSREAFYHQIKEQAIAYAIGVIDNVEIDRINIYQASIKAMQVAINGLASEPDHLLVDAVPLDHSFCTSDAIIKGDQKSVSIAAASILAKVTRDGMMQHFHQEYPHYQFDKNQGYGTKAHLHAIQTHGITPIHRQSFAPIKAE